METNKYEHKIVEEEIDQYWKKEKLYIADKNCKNKKKCYVLGMFPYPSGNSHMGHVRVYSLTDVYGRYMRMNGYNVLNPIGWDAFGLPAENSAIKSGVEPGIWTQQNIHRMGSEQLNKIGFSFDWETEIRSSDPAYYKWTQWLFIQMFKKGLIEKRKAPCNWCSSCKTVLANEQVIDGECWRCNTIVEQVDMDQWFIKISQYAELLDADIKKLKNWPEVAVNIQKEWIGRKEGLIIKFPIVGRDNEYISVFTTRADTIFGITCLVLSFDYKGLMNLIGDSIKKEVEIFCSSAKQQTEREVLLKDDISGFKTDIIVEHPFTKAKIPVYIGDYVLASFGTGAVMCVPAHDKRDHRFAQKYGFNIIEVVKPVNIEKAINLSEEAFVDEGILQNSDKYNNKTSAEAREAILSDLSVRHLAEKKIYFRLKDWCISRQRYWGVPIPMRKNLKDNKWEPIADVELPVLLPESYEEWKNQKQKQENFEDGYIYEQDTMDTFMCSSWYFYRFLDPVNDKEWVDRDKLNYWLPIDLYVGGMEHAAQHLIYARFLAKFLNKSGFLPVDEPVDHFLANGLVRLNKQKMSKSKGNIVIPVEIVEKYGADTLRLFILGDSPPEVDIDWNDSSIKSKYNYMQKMWILLHEIPSVVWDVNDEDKIEDSWVIDPLFIEINLFIANIDKSIKNFAFHKIVSELFQIMNFITSHLPRYYNDIEKHKKLIKKMIKIYLIGASIVLPFITDKLFRLFFDKSRSIHTLSWVNADQKAILNKKIILPVQINGKLAITLNLDIKGLSQEAVLKLAYEERYFVKKLDNRNIKNVIYLPDKVINVIV